MNPTIIEDIKARRVLDSRGNWAIEVDVITRLGLGRCAAPSGASTGKYEVVSYPENSVEKALVEVEECVAPELIGMDAEEQEVVDGLLREMDGTGNFSNIGGNTAVALSLACAKAAASSYGLPLYKYLGGNLATEIPYPLGNVIGGGAHAVNATDIQEFLVIPVGARNATEALRTNAEVHKRTRKALLETKGVQNLGKGDEGAWAPNLTDEEALSVLSLVAQEVEKETGVRIVLGMDVAASELWDGKKKVYVYRREGKKRTPEEQVNHILELMEKYHLYYVEDPLEEEDFESFAALTKEAKGLICGDDLYVTNVKRLEKGLSRLSTNAVLIKPNQCGTLTDTCQTLRLAKKSGITPIFSHRSGETVDDTIAHLAVAFGAPIIKTGVVGGERIAKLNELVRISEELSPHRVRMAALPEI
jgi:enolase